MYGRGASSIAEQIGKTTEEAQAIIDSFYKGFPKVKIWVDKTQAEVKQKGYVETLWGRRRRLPDVNLPPYTVKPLKNKTLFNPFIDCVDKANQELIDNIQKYEKLSLNIRNAREYQRLKDSAALENININSNVGFIKQAERQSVNCVDRGTQILTQAGWKSVDQLIVGEPIYSLNIKTGKIELDTVKNIFQYSGDFTGVRIKHNGFNAISTPEHKWPTYSRGNGKITLTETKTLSKYKNYGCRKIIRSANNDFTENPNWSLDALYILGMFFTDGSCYRINNKYEPSNRFHCVLYQKKGYTKEIIRQHLRAAGIQYTESTNADGYSSFYLKQPLATQWGRQFPQRCLTHEFINSLSQPQAKALFEGMRDGDGYSGTYICANSKEEVDLLQHLIVMMGKSSTYTYVNAVGKRGYSDKIANKEGFIETKKPYYIVNMLKRDHADVLASNCKEESLDFVWCVETCNHTWIARSEAGYTFITGNSRVQGGSADITKRAMISIYNDKEMQELGFKILLCIHDEIVGECPEENAEKVASRLSYLMMEAPKPNCMIPFKCDSSITNCWYEEEYATWIKEDFEEMGKDFQKLQEKHPERSLEELKNILNKE